ncbi:MAG: thermonuclease family protein [Longicatena sp.]
MKKIVVFVISIMIACIPLHANTKKEVKFAKCTDGDTAHFIIDGEDKTVRFLAIDAPEYTKEKEPYGKEASEYVCSAIKGAQNIQLEYDDHSDVVDKYGRELAWVFVDGSLLQKDLVAKGLAEVKYLYGDYEYTNTLKEVEKQAKQQKVNMWSDTTPQESIPIYMLVVGAIALPFTFVFVKGKRNQKRVIKTIMKTIKKN